MAFSVLNVFLAQECNDTANVSNVAMDADTVLIAVSNVTVNDNIIITNASDVSRPFLSRPSSKLNEVAIFLMVYFLPVIFIFGILGNSVSFLVFLSEKMRRVSTNVYLAALSASNSVFLLAVAVAWTDMLGWKLMHVNGLCQTTVYLTYCSGFLSVWLVVCITVENFVINFFLHKASCHCTIRRALGLVVLLFVSSLLLYDFAIWTTGIVSSNGTQFYCQTYQKYQSIVEIFTLIDVSLTLGIPSIVILALVIPTCVRNVPCRARAARLRNIMLSRRERALLRVTRLLCVIIVSYVLLTAPSHLNKLRHLLGKGRQRQGGSASTDMFIVFIVQTLYFLSFSMNFIYFLIWGKNFRDRFCYMSLALFRLLSRCRQKLVPGHVPS